jgi:NAD-dependent dihydropyrimidine dehydrogenase PreA subunit
MCEFCIQHGEGKKWYFAMKNYSDELLHERLSAEQREATGSETREEWLGRFMEYFEKPAITGVPVPIMDLLRAVNPAELRGPSASSDELLKNRKLCHFAQVLPIEDAEKVIDMVDSITRVPCGCRFLTTGKTDKRYCFGQGKAPQGLMPMVPDRASSLETLDKEEAKRIIREFDSEGLIHTLWTGVTPYIFGLCNCDRDCLAYRMYIEQRGMPSFFRAEYVARVDPEACSGCKDCYKQCQFGSLFYSSALGKVYIDPSRCFGCGLCRAACPTGAIELIPREQDATAAGIWLQTP